MKNLRELYAWGNCGISNDDIANLNLVKLYADSNPKIKQSKFQFFIKTMFCNISALLYILFIKILFFCINGDAIKKSNENNFL